MSLKAKTEQPKGGITVRRGVAAVFGALLITTSALAAVTLVRLASHDGGASPAAVNQSMSPVSQPALNNRVEANATTAIAPTTGSAPQAENDELQIVLSANGFAQAEVTHAAGAFALAVDNQDVTDEYVLQLKGAGGALLNEIRVQKGSAVWTVDLPAGTYTLMVANHPDWVCQITVQ
jgi:hypothetical protein